MMESNLDSFIFIRLSCDYVLYGTLLLNYESSSHQWGGGYAHPARVSDVWLVEVVVGCAS